jgi:hypothetical protein
VAVFFFGSLVSLPIAYRIKAFVFGYSSKEGFRRYWHDVTQNGLLKKFWSVWVPVNCTNFGLVPPSYRITVNSIVAFCWLMVLSTISSRQNTTDVAIPQRPSNARFARQSLNKKDLPGVLQEPSSFS